MRRNRDVPASGTDGASKLMMDRDRRARTGASAPGVEEWTPRMAVRHRGHCSDTERNAKWVNGVHEGRTQTYMARGACLAPERHEERRYLKGQPSSRTGENPPYGMIGGTVETSASFEARYAPLSYPTGGNFGRRRGNRHGPCKAQGHLARRDH